MVTIYDIAKKCGCAPATVSKALNDYYGVSKKMKERIINTAREMGYLPNTMARYLTTKRSYLIGVLIYIDDFTGFNHALFMSILNQFKTHLEEKGCDILLLSKNLKIGGQSFLNHCKTRQVDGVLAFGDFTSESVKELLDSDIPTIGYDYIGDKISGVTSDNYCKTLELTRYLIQLGHRDIVFIKGENNFVTLEREKGFLSAVEEAGAEVQVKIIQGKYHSQEYTYDITKKLLLEKNMPTAVMFPDDYSALGGMKAIGENGLNIPDDISVTGYDGLEITQYLHPYLTTVRQDVKAIGRMLAEKLMEEINSPKKENKEIILAKSEIIYGESCKKIR